MAEANLYHSGDKIILPCLWYQYYYDINSVELYAYIQELFNLSACYWGFSFVR